MPHSLDISTNKVKLLENMVLVSLNSEFITYVFNQFSYQVHSIWMIPFSRLSRFGEPFGRYGPSPLNRDTSIFIMSLFSHVPG